MADNFYGVSLGSGFDPHNVLKQGSTTSRKIELRVETAVSGIAGNKMEVIKAIDEIRAFIVKNNAEA